MSELENKQPMNESQKEENKERPINESNKEKTKEEHGNQDATRISLPL